MRRISGLLPALLAAYFCLDGLEGRRSGDTPTPPAGGSAAGSFCAAHGSAERHRRNQ